MLAYVRGPPVAVFAGSWLCSKSPVDGTPIALGEPFGDCEVGVARLMSIATSVRIAKQLGVRVFVSEELGEDAVDAAFAGGANGVLEELRYSEGDYREGAASVLLRPRDLAELVNTVRVIAETHRKPFDVLIAASLDRVHEFAPYVDGVVIVDGWVPVSVGEAGEIPEIRRCAHCGVDYLIYSNPVRRCIYCGRRLSGVIASTRPPRSRAVFRSVFKRYAGVTRLRVKIV
jgi:coenzyme F420-reducing hydrogenase delta subunit/DNA-directed RNA polymerase subunit RPC12/RpoP